MKTVARSLILLLSLTGIACAASFVDLTVTGRVTPDACQVELSDEGNVEHGNIPTHLLNADQATVLPSRLLDLSLLCTRPTLFALVGIDNRPESSPSPDFFGLGVNPHAPDQPLGTVKISFHDTVGDSQPMQVLASSDHGETWSRQTDAPPQTYMGFALPGDRQPDFIRQLLTRLKVDTTINAAQHLTLDREVPLDGSIVLDLRYL